MTPRTDGAVTRRAARPDPAAGTAEQPDRQFLLPLELRWRFLENDLAYFVIAAVERVGLSASQIKTRAGGKAHVARG